LTAEETPRGALAREVAIALGPQGAIARQHPGYVVRDGQLGLADEIASTIETRGCLVAEAGTGTGKTFAYLVPVLLSGGRVLISTGTRNLQDQLFDRDLPEVVRALGVHVDAALLKGRANYVCWYHLERNLAEGRFARREDIAVLRRIRRFADTSARGDRAEAGDVGEDAPAWSMATSTRENCLGQDCPDHGRCFLMRARQAAQRADVVVVNHHLFCADLSLRDEGVADLLPLTDTLIFDEAHQLPEAATQFFGRSVSTRRLLDFARDLLRAGVAEARDAADWTALSRDLEQSVRELRLAAGQPGRLDAAAVRGRPALLQAVDLCARAVGIAGSTLDSAAERGRELARCALRAAELRMQIDDWAKAVGDGEADAMRGTPTVTWAEVHAGGVTLHATPLSVAEPFRRHRESRPRAWVFLSATLAVGGDFGHFAGALGLDDAKRFVWTSPFDYARQGLLYVPQGIGAPSGPDFAERVFRASWPLVQANAGRAFLLCTTLRMVERLAGLLADAIAREAPELVLLVQGSASRAELLERFRRERAPVLVGSASFWEGVDVPGRQLSLVVIDKLPFAPPDEPVLRARIDATRRAGGEPFRELQLPAAAMALKQGAGRLIRSESDVGLLAVCDSRLAEKAYGRTLLRSLPPFRRTRSEEEALSFLRQPPQ
jgi:ATP-dependent DNA helicase DinG